jgi:hypothetical protein
VHRRFYLLRGPVVLGDLISWTNLYGDSAGGSSAGQTIRADFDELTVPDGRDFELSVEARNRELRAVGGLAGQYKLWGVRCNEVSCRRTLPGHRAIMGCGL